MRVVLGGPIRSVPSLGFTGLVSAIPRASLTLGGPSWTEVQVRDRRTADQCYVLAGTHGSM